MNCQQPMQQEQNNCGPNSENQDEKYKNLNKFSCKICLDLANEPVITSCGHLYCWECIYQWGLRKGMKTDCPYCKNGIDIEKLTPIFTGEEGEKKTKDIPKRPENQRQQSNQQQQSGQNQNNWFNNFGQHFSFGFIPGFAGFFGGGLGFNMSFGGNNQAQPQQQQNGQRQNRLMMFLPIILIAVQIIPQILYQSTRFNFFDDDDLDYAFQSSSFQKNSQFNKKKNQKTNFYRKSNVYTNIQIQKSFWDEYDFLISFFLQIALFLGLYLFTKFISKNQRRNAANAHAN